MRSLVIMRGISGCGKSTFIKNRGWMPYTLSLDDIRLLINSPILTIDGNFQINQDNLNVVFDLLTEMLEMRMKKGDFTVIDGTHILSKEFSKYLTLAKKYKYRVYCIDFTDIPIEEVRRRNNTRDEINRVPEYVIDKFHTRLQGSKVPSGIKVLKPEEWEEVLIKPIDLSTYDKIHHIGDIHGCYTVLKEYIENNGNLNENEFYIFTGDFIDRGIENAEVIEFLLSIMDNKNVQLIEGNH